MVSLLAKQKNVQQIKKSIVGLYSLHSKLENSLNIVGVPVCNIQKSFVEEKMCSVFDEVFSNTSDLLIQLSDQDILLAQEEFLDQYISEAKSLLNRAYAALLNNTTSDGLSLRNYETQQVVSSLLNDINNVVENIENISQLNELHNKSINSNNPNRDISYNQNEAMENSNQGRGSNLSGNAASKLKSKDVKIDKDEYLLDMDLPGQKKGK